MSTPQFDQFAWANLYVNETMGHTVYPNYFFEGAVAKSRFGELTWDGPVSVEANSLYRWDAADSIGLWADCDRAVPEPATVLLLSLGPVGLAARGMLARRPA